MNEFWIALITFVGGVATRYIRPRGSRELALVEQLQEENQKLQERVEKLERKSTLQTRRELRMYKYIVDLHQAALAGNAIPPIPNDLFGNMFEEREEG